MNTSVLLDVNGNRQVADNERDAIRVLIVSNDDEMARRVQSVFCNRRPDAPAPDVASLEAAVWSSSLMRPDVHIMVMPTDYDDAIRTMQELRTVSRAPIVAIGPADASEILRTLHEGGGQQYLEADRMESELDSLLTRWLAAPNSMLGGHEGTQAGCIMAVFSPNGGSGASTLAVTLAGALAGKHRSCALVDLNDVGDLSTLLNLQPTHSITDICQNLSRLDKRLFQKILCRHESGISLMASPPTFKDIASVTPEGVRTTLLACSAHFPYVIADVDRALRDVQVEALHLAQKILIVFRLDFPSLRNVRRALDRLEMLEISRDRIKLVVSRFRQPQELPVSAAKKALGVEPDFYIPDDPKNVNRAANSGVPLFAAKRRSPANKQIQSMAAALNGAPASHSPWQL